MLELKSADEITPVTDAELVADGDKDTTYSLRHITTDKHREIVKANTDKVPNRRTHQRDDVVNWEAVQDDLVDYAIADWSGVVAKGQPVPCERVYKLLLDGPRKTAILERAGMNEVAAAPERRAESFRAPADVR
jgi:hypothetical protein